MAKLHEPVIAMTTLVAASTGTVTIQPSSDQEWILTGLGATANNIAYMGEIELYNGTTAILLRKGASSGAMPPGDARYAQWLKPMRFGVTNGYYLRVRNIDASSARFIYTGTVTGVGSTGIGDIKAGITASVAAGSYITVQPPAGEGWVLLEAGCESAGWTDTDEGGGPFPNIDVRIYDGTNTVVLLSGSNASIWNPLRVVFSNAVYLRIYNADSSARAIGYIAQRIY